MADVSVTKVTVDYAFGGKAFTVVFDPTKVGAIFFNKGDTDRAKQQQADETGQPPKQHILNPSSPIKSTFSGDPTHAVSVETGSDTTVTTAALWWHTNACTFFHPEA